jgi:hypothetical protein
MAGDARSVKIHSHGRFRSGKMLRAHVQGISVRAGQLVSGVDPRAFHASGNRDLSASSLPW